jgi:hypothetical protein
VRREFVISGYVNDLEIVMPHPPHAGEGEAVHAGKMEIGKQEIDRNAILQNPERVAIIMRFRDVVSFGRENSRQGIGQSTVVIDDEDSTRDI